MNLASFSRKSKSRNRVVMELLLTVFTSWKQSMLIVTEMSWEEKRGKLAHFHYATVKLKKLNREEENPPLMNMSA